MAVDHAETGYLERRAYCGAPPYGEALENSFEDYGTPSRDQVFGLTSVRGSGLDLTAYSDADPDDKSNGDHNYPLGCGRQLGK